MPRRKQMVPKKHGDETTSSETTLISDKCETNEKIMDDEILDLSIKKKKSNDIQVIPVVPSVSKLVPTKNTSGGIPIYQPNPVISAYHPNLSLIPHPYFPFSMPVPQVNFNQKSGLQTIPNSSPQFVDNTLSKLNSLVSKVGKETLQKHPASVMNDVVSRTTNSASNGLNFHELWYRFVKKEENAEVKRINEAKQIFTCLQCQASFQTMDLLVKHMETTRHFANIPKHYSWSLQYARQKMRQMKMKMKYSDKMMYFCFLCQTPFTEPVHVHFNCVHDMHNPVENMKHVHIISMGLQKSVSANSKKKWSRSSSTSTNGSEGSSPTTPYGIISDTLGECSKHSSKGKTTASISSSTPTDETNSFLLKMEEMVDSTKSNEKRNLFEKCSK